MKAKTFESIRIENNYLRSGCKGSSDGCEVLHGVFRAHGLACSRLAGYDNRLIIGSSEKKHFRIIISNKKFAIYKERKTCVQLRNECLSCSFLRCTVVGNLVEGRSLGFWKNILIGILGVAKKYFFCVLTFIAFFELIPPSPSPVHP
jgi:hypothetical protein